MYCFLPSVVAVVNQIRPSPITGVECPSPSSLVFQAILRPATSSHSVGKPLPSSAATWPLKVGPLLSGQERRWASAGAPLSAMTPIRQAKTVATVEERHARTGDIIMRDIE